MLAACRAHPELVAQLVPAPFDFRLGPTITRLIREGAIGEVTEANVTVLNGSGLDRAAPLHWRHRTDYSGHNTMTMGIYAEIVQRWLGDTLRVSASARTVVTSRTDPETGAPYTIGIPDSLGVLAELASGVRVTYQLSAVASGAPFSGIVVHGAGGAIRWTPDDRATLVRSGTPPEEIVPDPGTDRGWQVESDFVASIREGAPVTLTNFDDGVKYMRFTDAVWTSWSEGRRVAIEPVA
jgi:predicted dehydrogenase